MKLRLPQQQPDVEAQELEPLIDLYIEHKLIGCKAETVRNYALYMNAFRRWWRIYGPPNEYKLSPAAFRVFDHYLRTDYRTLLGKKIGRHGLHRIGKQVADFCKWLESEGCIDAPINAWVVVHPMVRTPQYYPSPDEIERLFNYCNEQPQRIQYMAGVSFMFATGVRLMEVTGALIENLSFQTPIWNLTVGADHRGHCWLEETKGNKPRYVVFGCNAGLMLKAWVRSCGRQAGSIFGLKREGLAMVLKRASQRCDLPELSCHAARRAFGDFWTESHQHDHIAHAVLQIQLGHSVTDRDSVTISRYVDLLHNKRRLFEKLYAYHVDPVELLEIDWRTWPVQIAPTEPERALIELKPALLTAV